VLGSASIESAILTTTRLCRTAVQVRRCCRSQLPPPYLRGVLFSVDTFCGDMLRITHQYRSDWEIQLQVQEVLMDLMKAQMQYPKHSRGYLESSREWWLS